MTENSILDNIEVHNDFAIISINPKLYPLSVIYSAAYWILDKVHVIIDGDPETEILVEIRQKNKEEPLDLKEVGYEFNDELINYSVYTVQATRNKRLREYIMENSLSGNTSQNIKGPFPQQREYPKQRRADNCAPRNSWGPGEQSLKEEEIVRIRQTTAKEKQIFSGPEGIDVEGISKPSNYRHSKNEF